LKKKQNLLSPNQQQNYGRKTMPLQFAIHKWKKEKMPTVARKVIEALQQVPEGVNICSSWISAGQDGAWCVWEAESPEQVKKFLTAQVPEMETEVKPVLQWFPPSPDLYAFIHTLVTQKS
jgi:hypothetical protein